MPDHIPDFLRTKTDNAIRRELRSIIDSYHHYWDLLAELLQNSRDAIERRQRRERDAGLAVVDGQIKIGFDAVSRTIFVEDNGTGIDPSFVAEVLAPGGGDKDPDDDQVGEKGVGLTFVAFSGDVFAITTLHENGACEAHLTNAASWVGGSPTAPYPDFSIATKTDGLADQTFTRVSVGQIPVRQDRDLFAISLEDFKWILRTKTAVGDTRRLLRDDPLPEIGVTYEWIGLDGGAPMVGEVPAGHPDLAESFSTLTIEEVNTQFVRITAPDARRKFLRNKVVTGRVTSDDGTIEVYGVMLPGNRAFSEIAAANHLTPASDGDSDPLVRSGIFVSTKSMPTGIEIEPANKGAYPAYYKRCFFLVESNRIPFDLGRKSMHWRPKQRLQDVVADLFLKFEQVAKFQGDPQSPRPTSESRAERKNRIKKEWKEIHDRHDLDWPGIKFGKYPTRQEAAVAALFHELIGAGKIKNLRPLATGYSSQYDLHAAHLKDDEEIDVVIEFKARLENVIADFREGTKTTDDIDLLVCWDVEEEKLALVGLSLTPVTSEAEFDGVTHELHLPSELSTETIPVIVMKTLHDRHSGQQS
jgi:hypothetical protein